MSKGKRKEIQGRMGGGKQGYDPLGGTLCHHKCKIHKEPCTVVMRYKNPSVQATVEAIRAIQGAPPHSEESHHYCELCALAMQQNRTLDSFTRDKRGRIVLRKLGTQRMSMNEDHEIIWNGDLLEEE